MAILRLNIVSDDEMARMQAKLREELGVAPDDIELAAKRYIRRFVHTHVAELDARGIHQRKET